jgi:hypothetical protein
VLFALGLLAPAAPLTPPDPATPRFAVLVVLGGGFAVPVTGGVVVVVERPAAPEDTGSVTVVAPAPATPAGEPAMVGNLDGVLSRGGLAPSGLQPTPNVVASSKVIKALPDA